MVLLKNAFEETKVIENVEKLAELHVVELKTKVTNVKHKNSVISAINNLMHARMHANVASLNIQQEIEDSSVCVCE